MQFHGSVSAQEADSERSWSVSFTLIEYLSVAEKVEQREDAPVVEAQQTPGVETTAEETAIPENYTGFESVLKSLDTMLAPSNETP